MENKRKRTKKDVKSTGVDAGESSNAEIPDEKRKKISDEKNIKSELNTRANIPQAGGSKALEEGKAKLVKGKIINGF